MSFYILEGYVLECKERGLKPTFKGLHEWKRLNWND